MAAVAGRKRARGKWAGVANVLTLARIALSLALLALPAFSPPFFVVYAIAGLTDMLDGPVARRTGTVSQLGGKLDSAADFVLVVVCLVKILPVLVIPAWLWTWIAVIAIVKAVNVVSGFVVCKRLVTPHTMANKAAGFLVFLVPFVLPFCGVVAACVLPCAVATFAAIQEGHFVRSGCISGF